MAGVPNPFFLLLTTDNILGSGIFTPQQWGIFAQNGEPIIIGDAVDAVQFTRDYQLSEYPQERGAFTSYNKVQVPFQAQVSFLIARTRQNFLLSIESAAGSLQLVSVYTPEIQYPSANIIHYSYRRDSRSGVELIRVDVWVEEVRVWSQAQLSSNSAIVGGDFMQSGIHEGTASPTASPVGEFTQSGASEGTPFGVQSNNGASPVDQGEQAPLGTTAPFNSPLTIPPF